jgi:hypothetical protein
VANTEKISESDSEQSEQERHRKIKQHSPRTYVFDDLLPSEVG